MKLLRGLLLTAAVGLVTHQLVAASAPAEAGDAPLTTDEALVVRLVNSERQERGLEPLALDSLLTKVARQHSRDMAQRGYFSHLAPEPLPATPLDRYLAASGRRPEAIVGENIGYAGQPVMAMIHVRMMESAEHKANILDQAYSGVGVGIYALADGPVWVTEMFVGREPHPR